MKPQFFVVLILWAVCQAQAFTPFNSWQDFDNLNSKTATLPVRCFVQDATGMMWLGTARGLYSYDGYDVRHYISEELSSHQIIKCCLIFQETLFLGGENGILLFNLQTGKFSKPDVEFNETVSAFFLYKGEVWLGAESGIYIYNMEKDMLRPVDLHGEEFPRHIQSLAADRNYLYVGMTEGLGCYSFSTGNYEVLEKKDDLFVGAFCLDEPSGDLWIGTARSLLRMNLNTRKIEKVHDFYVVKSLVKSGSDMLIGTDNGLCIYDENDQVHYALHSSTNEASLASNVVSCIYQDKDENLWIGTDNGVSLLPHHKALVSYSLSSVTGTDAGNQIYCIRRTRDGKLWLGGSQGLIELGNDKEGNPVHRWFGMSFPHSFIPHNRIRALFEDSRGRLWVASDRGILLYNQTTGQFESYQLNDYFNWIYDILEMPDGDLWVATFDGVYSVSPEQAAGTIKYKRHISKAQGLYTNDVYQLAQDSEHNLWVLTNNHHVDRINLTSRTVLPVEKIISTDAIDAYAVMNDSLGRVWISYSNRLLRLTTHCGRVTSVEVRLNNAVASMEVFSMEEVENEVWLSTSEGLFMVDKETLVVQQIGLPEKYLSIFYDVRERKVWLGTTDKLAIVNPDFIRGQTSAEVRVTHVVVNGSLELEYAVCHKGKVRLPSNQNSLQVSFSDYAYSDRGLTNYSFKLKGAHSQWMDLNAGNNSILLPNLSPGNYELYICPSSQVAYAHRLQPVLSVSILPPWYFTWYARCGYLLTCGVFFWWVLRFFRMRHLLHKERELRESLMQQAKLKMSFFTNIAHEFKTPLSLIVAPSGKLLGEEKEKEKRALLELIHENAKKLGNLIHLTIEAYQDKDKIQQTFMPSEIEFVEFSRSIFNAYKENMRNGLQEFVFNTNRKVIYVCADLFKMEAILNNLLSNACKFTSEHGSIILSLEYEESSQLLYVKVTDTGVGIPEDEIPFVFQRYYQSSRTVRNDKEGTGVGLAIVKEYVEMHRGKVNIVSGKEGTTVLLTLPIGIEKTDLEKEKAEVTPALLEDSRPLVVIVEDNVSTAHFIRDLLADDYRCVVAYDGKNGLQLCMDLLPDLIITDAMMPVMDGIEMCRSLRNCIPLSTVPVIMLTAKTDMDIEFQSAQLNVDAFLAKPFECSLLLEHIRRLLGNKERLEHQIRIEHIKQPTWKGEISADEKLLLKITSTIEKHIDDPALSVESLSQWVDISQKQLYRKVKQLTGMSTVEYIRSIRLKKAALLFQSGNFSVAEVMYMVGFSNASYFTRCFVAEFGKTPAEYLSEKKG